ncbi:hypothetical protein BMS3Bbin04_01541 [bacterium BMS3Bbin04]|nr:hypothetical protein BMS3Bbin04_01541 [bacterium BMS3Bbin04]
MGYVAIAATRNQGAAEIIVRVIPIQGYVRILLNWTVGSIIDQVDHILGLGYSTCAGIDPLQLRRIVRSQNLDIKCIIIVLLITLKLVVIRIQVDRESQCAFLLRSKCDRERL